MQSYSLDQVPLWCHMSPDEHQCCGGCWGISYGEVAKKGESHCYSCEYHINNIVPPPLIVGVKDGERKTLAG